MYERSIAPVMVALFVLLGSPPLKSAYAESETETTKKRAAAVAEEKARVAEQEAEIAKEAAELEEKKATLAGKKAAVAKKEAKVIRGAAARTGQLEQTLAELKAKETERGLVYTLGDVLFEFNEAELKPAAMQKLYPLVTILRENPKRDILIEGHTDSVGSDSYNVELSQRRATAVRNFLVENGIAPDRINAHGYGKTYPVSTNTSAAGREQNRRVEVVVLREGERVAERLK